MKPVSAPLSRLLGCTAGRRKTPWVETWAGAKRGRRRAMACRAVLGKTLGSRGVAGGKQARSFVEDVGTTKHTPGPPSLRGDGLALVTGDGPTAESI